MREQGSDIGAWGYLWFWSPVGMPAEVVDQLYGHLVKAIQHPDTKELFAKGGAEASGIPPAEMVREVKRLDDRWSGVSRKVGVKLD